MPDTLTTTQTASTTTADSNASFSRLLNAGEDIFTLVTGKTTPNNPQIIEALSHLADGSLPFIEQKAHFDLTKVLAGGADILTGISLVLTGLKTARTPHQTSPSQTATAASPATKLT